MMASGSVHRNVVNIPVCRFLDQYLYGELGFNDNIYHPRMRVGNVFGHVCVSVCVFCLFRL